MMGLEELRARAVTAVYVGRVGDVIVATPFLRALRRRFPEAKIRFIVGHRSLQVLPLLAFIDDWAVVDRPERPLSHARLALSVLTRPCDLLVDLNSSYSNTSAILARLVRAPAKLAFAKGRWDRVFTHQVPAPGEREHMSERYRRLAEALGAPYEPELELRLPEADERRGEDILRGLPAAAGRTFRIAIHPGNMDRYSFRWPEEKFAALADRLTEDPTIQVCFFGGPGEESKVGELAASLKRPAPVLPPASLGVVGAVLKRLDLLVCTPTGTTHLANAVGARTFTIHAGYTHAVWRCLGPRHGAIVSALWQSCRELSVDEVYRELAAFIARLRGPRGS